MSDAAEIASLRAEVARLTQKVNQPPAARQDAGLASQIKQMQQDIQKLQNWQATLRGERGIEVRGNVITGSQSETDPTIRNARTPTLVTGCLNGAAASGITPYIDTPCPL